MCRRDTFKYLGCVLDESGTDGAECSRKAASERRVAVAIRSLVNARSLQFECARVLYEPLLEHVLTYGSETTICEEERTRIRALQMDSLRMDNVSSARIRELCGVTKCVFSGGSAMWSEWRMTGLLRGSCRGV